MCKLRLKPTVVLAAVVFGDAASGWRACPDRSDARACLDCLSEGLHDAADLIEGLAQRRAAVPITPPPGP